MRSYLWLRWERGITGQAPKSRIEEQPCLGASMETGTSVLRLQGTESCQQPVWAFLLSMVHDIYFLVQEIPFKFPISVCTRESPVCGQKAGVERGGVTFLQNLERHLRSETAITGTRWPSAMVGFAPKFSFLLPSPSKDFFDADMKVRIDLRVSEQRRDLQRKFWVWV